MDKKLSWFSLGVSLATIHYGLGFLVGSGEAIYTVGSKGILYAAASALGILSFVFIAPFYLREKEPIWDLMGRRYGEGVRSLVGSLSGVWMVGVVASQILGGAWALSLFGINNIFSMVLIAALILFLSKVSIKNLSKIFSVMLFLSSGALLAILFKVGFEWLPISLYDLLSQIDKITATDFLGIVLPTVLVTFIGMDFHQFIVRSENRANAIGGSVFGSLILFGLAIALLGVVWGGIQGDMLGNISDPKQTIPALLLNFGNSYLHGLGVLFALPLVLVSIGSGSGVTRIVGSTISDLDNHRKIKIDPQLVTVILAFFIALTGSSIISLIVSFYAIYVGSVLIPFLLYLLSFSGVFKISKEVVVKSLRLGFIGSVLAFVFRFIPGAIPQESYSTFILFAGCGASIFIAILYILDARIRKGRI